MFYPHWGGHIYGDPDLRSFIKSAQDFKTMVDSLAGSHLDISTAASSQLFVALNSTLQFISSDRATNHTFRCHLNECAHNLMQSFQEISDICDRLLTKRTRRNVWDIFLGQSTATLAAKVRKTYYNHVIGRDISRQAG